MTVMGVSRFERFFRVAGDVDVDKDDLKRYGDFVDLKLDDLLVRGEANARANDRDIIEPWDLPVTKGLQESIHQFDRLDEELELRPILQQLAERAPVDPTSLSEETEQRLPELVGGLSLALARSFRIIDPEVANPSTDHWERSFRLFELLL
jgi:hypothetical protein